MLHSHIILTRTGVADGFFRDAGGWIGKVSLPDCVTELLIPRTLFAGDFKDGQNGGVKEVSTGSTSDSKGELILLVEHGES
jgi:hypothetical protein